MDDQFVLRVAFALIPGLGGKTLARLLEHFGSLAAIQVASASDLRAVPRIGPQMSAAIKNIDLDRTRASIEGWQSSGVSILFQGEPPYPPLLSGLADAPPVLFYRGDISPNETNTVALVGTRHPSAASAKLAFSLASMLSACGWTIVSGLAAGIDAASHRGALHGRTLALLGCGVLAPYPPENIPLADQIMRVGALLSEVHPLAAPNSSALVSRNRLITGISRALIVIEAGETSGSMHAVRFASVQNRPVYAVENVCNRHLFAAGARPVSPATLCTDLQNVNFP
ncbi:MAG TPA: DNA-processing protein DprA [Aggregatilineaceae bacterium]|nr:DNA-processing protein DprA [Aggregatilineaceae bacterium]